MRMLILYHQTAPRHVLYLRRLAANMEACGHALYGPQCEDFDAARPIENVIEAHGPVDAILVMEPKFGRWIPPLNHLKIPKAIILSDYYPRKRAWEQTHWRLDADGYDLILAQTIYELRALRKNGRKERAAYLPMSVDTEMFQDRGETRDLDVMASWGMNQKAYPLRRRVRDLLLAMPVSSFLGQTFFDDYVAMLNRARIFVNSGTIYRNIQSRFTEVTACGCMLLTDAVDDLPAQGFRNDYHLVVYHGLNDLKTQVDYYLRHDAEREQIARNGRDWVVAEHSNEVRIREIVKLMETIS